MHFPSMNRRIGTITRVSTLYFVLFTFIISSGATPQCPPVYVFTGAAANDQFGISVSGAGDVNNDGFADLIVGALLNGGFPSGRAYVYSGQTGALLHTFTAEVVGDLFGRHVSGAGDVNNDGFADLIVGAFINNAGGTNAGRAYVYSGQTGALLHTFTGEAAFDGLGNSVSGAGDVNDDGFADLIVGAFLSTMFGNYAGRAYVYSGQTGALLHTFTAEAVGDFFGFSVSGAGDVNFDGFADLIVGGPGNNAGGSYAGRAYVYSGQTGALLHTFTGEAAFDGLGNSVSGAGDVNDDGFADLIVGAFLSTAFGNYAGRAYVYSGQTGALLHTFTGEATNDFVGFSVSGAGDVNNDGFADLIVGGPGNNAGGSYAGRAYVYSGHTGTLLHTFTGAAAFDGLGNSVSGAGDVNDDGFADLIVGDYLNGAGGTNAGRAYVYSGRPCVCGDINGDRTVTMEDFDAFIQFYFYAGPPPSGIGDVNCSGQIDLADIMYLIYYIKGAIPELCCLNTPTPPGRQRLYYEGVDIK